MIKEGFQEKVGPEIEIIIGEVENIDKTGPRIISKVDRTKFKIHQYI